MSDAVYDCPRCGALWEPGRGLCDRCGALLSLEGLRAVQTGQTCFSCGAQFNHPADRCESCGADLGAECENCGAIVDPRVRHCPQCKADRHAVYHQARAASWNGLPGAPSPSPSFPLFRYSFPLIVAVVFMIGALYQLHATGRWDLDYTLAAAGIFAALLALFLFSFSRRGHTAEPRGVAPIRDGTRTEVFRTRNLGRAEHLASVLNSEGIPAMVAERHTASLEPMALLTGIRVLVPADREDEAREVMKAFSFKGEGEE